MLMAMGLGSAVILPAAGALTDRFGPRGISIAGGGLLIFTTIAFVSSATLVFVAIIILLVARGAGLALAQMPAITAAYTQVDEAKTGDAATLINIGQRLGGALGAIVMVAAIEQFRVRDGISSRLRSSGHHFSRRAAVCDTYSGSSSR